MDGEPMTIVDAFSDERWVCPGGCHEFYDGSPCDCYCHDDTDEDWDGKDQAWPNGEIDDDAT